MTPRFGLQDVPSGSHGISLSPHSPHSPHLLSSPTFTHSTEPRNCSRQHSLVEYHPTSSSTSTSPRVAVKHDMTKEEPALANTSAGSTAIPDIPPTAKGFKNSRKTPTSYRHTFPVHTKSAPSPLSKEAPPESYRGFVNLGSRCLTMPPILSGANLSCGWILLILPMDFINLIVSHASCMHL